MAKAQIYAQIVSGPQAVILVGGRGTRLGRLTDHTPKPLLAVGGVPFLEHLIANLARHGFRRIVLLAGYLADQMQGVLDRAPQLGVEITCVIEPEPAGTGGALIYAQSLLDRRFLLLNGDSLLDVNYLFLSADAGWREGDMGRMALRAVADGSRYGAVEHADGRVTHFAEKSGKPGPAVINGGIYWLDIGVLDMIGTLPCSLEQDILPVLAQSGRLGGELCEGYFIDIGVPDDFQRAQKDIPAWWRRPAVFLDRDGVLNADIGYAHRPDQIEWLPGVREAVRYLNEQNYFVFVVTNQAGVARGLYDESTVHALHAWMQRELARDGAHIDDWRYCPYHPDGSIDTYRLAHHWRKPAPGMILDLLETWPVLRDGSFLIGDRDGDVQAATAVGIPGYIIESDNVLDQVRALVAKHNLKSEIMV